MYSISSFHSWNSSGLLTTKLAMRAPAAAGHNLMKAGVSTRNEVAYALLTIGPATRARLQGQETIKRGSRDLCRGLCHIKSSQLSDRQP
jgi:hypothetical protein